MHLTIYEKKSSKKQEQIQIRERKYKTRINVAAMERPICELVYGDKS